MLKRFKDIMASNFYALLEKTENPEKMVDQYVRELQIDLRNVTAETASVIAQEHRTKRALNECLAEIDKLQRYAKRAIELQNEIDARSFLERKAQVALQEARLRADYEQAVENSNKIRQMQDKLQSDIQEIEIRSQELKRKLTKSKAQEKINQMNNSASSFAKMEEKVNRALYTAEAKAELQSPHDELNQLMAQYDQKHSSNTSIDDELEALKNSLKKK